MLTEERQYILARHLLNNQPQKCILHYKENRRAKCYGRRVVMGFLQKAVLFDRHERVEQLFYFCGKKTAYCRNQSGVTYGTQREKLL